MCCSAIPGPVTRYGRVMALHLHVKDSGVPTTHGQGEQERKGSPRSGVGGRPACLDAQADRASGGRFESSFFQKSPWGLPVETHKCGFRAAGGSHFTPSPRRPVFHHELLRLVRRSLGFHKAKLARGNVVSVHRRLTRGSAPVSARGWGRRTP